MRKMTILSLFIPGLKNNLLSQPLILISYQVEIWDGIGDLESDMMISKKLSILQKYIKETVVYSEIKKVQTNSNRLEFLFFEGGTDASGKKDEINWNSGSYFLKTKIDPTGRINYFIVGTNQLVSVPYSLHSEKTETILTNNQGITGQWLIFDKYGKMKWFGNDSTHFTNHVTYLVPTLNPTGGNIIPHSTYYFKDFGTNRLGIVYGTEFIFTTNILSRNIPIIGIPAIIDMYGNNYQIVQIGCQCWTIS